MSALQGKKILITRPREQFEPWASQLRTLGAVPVCFPLIEIEPVLDSPAIQDVLQKLNTFHWIVLASVNAASSFIDILKNCGVADISPSFAAVGSKTADYLNSQGINAEFIPSEYTSAKLAEELPHVHNKNILLPRTDMADDALYNGLTERGALVDEVITYQTRLVTDKADELKKILDDGIDIAAFASPSAADAFFSMVPAPGENILLAAIGPVTAKRINELDETDIIAEVYTTEGLTGAMNAYFEKQNINT